MIPTQLLCAVFLITRAADVASQFRNECPQPTVQEPSPAAFFYSHPTDPRYFITCAHGNANLLACPPRTSWNNLLQTCTGNEFTSGLTNAPCSTGALIVPHAISCQRYYNCSQAGPGWNRYFEKFEAECPYPQLFDANDLRCKPYSEAVCGQWRTPAKDPCDYLANRCGSAHCEPCGSRLPSCVGFPDGTFNHPKKPNSPFQILCVAERLYRILYCNPQSTGGGGGPVNTTKTDCQITWESAF